MYGKALSEKADYKRSSRNFENKCMKVPPLKCICLCPHCTDSCCLYLLCVLSLMFFSRLMHIWARTPIVYTCNEEPWARECSFWGLAFQTTSFLTKNNSGVSGLNFFCLQYCFSCRIIVTKREFGSVLECAPYSCLCSHQLRSHGSIYLWLVCHVYEFEKGFSPQRVWAHNVSIILKCCF